MNEIFQYIYNALRRRYEAGEARALAFALLEDGFGVERTARGNVADVKYATNQPKVFVCGDMRRGQSLVVWALREGRDTAAVVDESLMGYTNL